MIVRTSIFTVLVFAASLLATTKESEKIGYVQSKLNSILDKAGIEFNGSFRSQYMQSDLDAGVSGDSAIDWGKKSSETNQWTSVDFDILARPNDALNARCMFRMHQNWENFFSDVANPIFLRWLSIDANIKEMIRFNVGSYRQHYSPLTLWSPDIEIPYEPDIFTFKRMEAMKEVFLGNNDRILQGVNFNFDAEIVPIFNEFHFNAQLSRLRLGETSILSGSAVAAYFEKSNMDRYFTSVNTDIVALRGLGFGFTLFDVFDLPATYNGVIEKGKILAEQTIVGAVRINPTSKIFLENENILVGLNVEAAFSMNRDSAWYDTTAGDSTFNTTNVNGLALDANLNGMFKFGTGSVSINLGFMNNDNKYTNEMAQSPSFLGQRILNIENDYEHQARLYTTFDALYNYVFKFTPSANNSWTKEPRRKLSYINAILDKGDLDSVNQIDVRLDPALQTVFPLGPATPNRTGPKGEVELSLFNGGVKASVDVAMLNEVEADTTVSTEKTSFTKLGGGLCVDIATWVKSLNKCKLSFGYSLEGAKNSKVMSGVDENGSPVYSNMATNNTFMNLGLYYNFWKRFSLLGGYQQIINKNEIVGYTTTITQVNIAGGLEYKITDGRKVIAKIGQVGVDFADTPEYNFRANQVEFYLVVNF